MAQVNVHDDVMSVANRLRRELRPGAPSGASGAGIQLTRNGSRWPVLLLAASVLITVIVPSGAAGQITPITVFDSLAPMQVLSPRARIALLEEQLAVDPDDYELRWRAAQDYAQVGLTEPNSEMQEQLWRRAYDHATTAKTVSPDGLEGRYWLAVVAGLIADVTGGRTKVRMGDVAYRESAGVLEVDSLHAGAHYLQGRVHASVMRLNSVMRFIAKLLVGGEALGNASWEQAEFHLRRAAELEPQLAMHHLQLALAYESMGMPEQMRGALLDAVAASLSTPYQDEYKARARRLLDRGREP